MMTIVTQLVLCGLLRGERQSPKQAQQLAIDLVNPHSAQYRVEPFTGPSQARVLSEMPPAAEYIVIHKRLAINALLATQSEDHLCIQLTCIGVGGVPLEGFERCHIMAGIVRDWIKKTAKNANRVLTSLKEPVMIFATQTSSQDITQDAEQSATL
jgi:hypothetical protein